MHADAQFASCVEQVAHLPGSPTPAPVVRHDLYPAVSAARREVMLHGDPSALACVIDHSLLKPDARPDDIRRLCDEAITHRFAAVCVNSLFAPLAADHLKGTLIPVASVVGFPLGAAGIPAVASETAWAVGEGAAEIDMVIPVGLIKARDLEGVYHHIASVTAAAGSAMVKVIIETCLLTDEEKVLACLLALKAGAAYVKTSTGFNGSGATVEDVALLRRVAGEHAGVKASGGIRTTEQARAMVAAGASRIGASASLALIRR